MDPIRRVTPHRLAPDVQFSVGAAPIQSNPIRPWDDALPPRARAGAAFYMGGRATQQVRQDRPGRSARAAGARDGAPPLAGRRARSQERRPPVAPAAPSNEASGQRWLVGIDDYRGPADCYGRASSAPPPPTGRYTRPDHRRRPGSWRDANGTIG